MNKNIYAKLNDELDAEFAEFSSDVEAAEQGFFPYEEQEKPVTPGNTIPHNYRRVYAKKKGKIIMSWEAYPNYEAIERLKKRLTATDYKVIKCYEASLVNADMPYDVTAIHQERQEIRNEINRLEACE